MDTVRRGLRPDGHRGTAADRNALIDGQNIPALLGKDIQDRGEHARFILQGSET